MWPLVADGLLKMLNSGWHFAQRFGDNLSTVVAGNHLTAVCQLMQAALRTVEQWRIYNVLSVDATNSEIVGNQCLYRQN